MIYYSNKNLHEIIILNKSNKDIIDYCSGIIVNYKTRGTVTKTVSSSYSWCAVSDNDIIFCTGIKQFTQVLSNKFELQISNGLPIHLCKG